MRKLLSRAAMLVVGVIAASQAQALTFNFSNVGGAGANTRAGQGFRIAAGYWSSVLSDPVTVNLNIGFSNLGPDILGSTGSSLFGAGVTDFYGALYYDRTSRLDRVAFNHLQLQSDSLSVITPGYLDPMTKTGVDTTKSILDEDGSANNSVLLGTSANFKALGAGPSDDSDATIIFNSALPFDFDPSNGIRAGFSDFIGVAIHEIGHALGFESGVDDYDFIGCPNGPACEDFTSVDANDYAIGRVLDLYRYSGPGALDWSVGQEAYFSIDGGATELFGDSNFSTGAFNGDGWQASHWKAPSVAGQNTCQPFIGVMNPYLCDGRQAAVTASDLAAMDAIGWDVNFDVLANPSYRFTSSQAYLAAVPEPATWLMMIAGFGFVGGVSRRQRRRAALA